MFYYCSDVLEIKINHLNIIIMSSKESVTFLNQHQHQQQQHQQKALKVIVVGDGYIGKTCLLSTYVYKKFPNVYSPTIFENHSGK